MIQIVQPSIRSREKRQNKIINTAKSTKVSLLLIHLGKNKKIVSHIAWSQFAFTSGKAAKLIFLHVFASAEERTK